MGVLQEISDFDSFKITSYLKNSQTCTFFKKQFNPEDADLDWEENTTDSDIIKSIDNLLDSGKPLRPDILDIFENREVQGKSQVIGDIQVSVEAL